MGEGIQTRKGTKSTLGTHMIIRRSHEGTNAPIDNPLDLDYYNWISEDVNFNSATLSKSGSGVVSTTNSIINGGTLRMSFENKLIGAATYTVNLPVNTLKDHLGNPLKGIYNYTFTVNPHYVVTKYADHSDINTLISVIPDNSTIYFVGETFTLNGAIVISRSNITLIGVDGKTILKNNSTLGDTVGVIKIKGVAGELVTNVTIKGFSIDGGYSAGMTSSGVSIEYAGNTDLNTGDSYDALKSVSTILNDAGVKIIDCVIFNNSFAGIYSINSCSLTIDGSVIYKNDYSGIYFEKTVMSSIFSNTIENNDINGIRFMVGSNYNICSGNSIQNNASSGVLAHTTYYNTIDSNTIQNNGGYGVEIYGGVNISIAKNTIQNNQFSGILLTLGSLSRITSNTIQNNNSHGIYFSGYSNSVLSGNTIQTNVGIGIKLDEGVSENNIVVGNISKSNSEADIFLGGQHKCLVCSNQTTLTIGSTGGNNKIYNNYPG